MSFNDTLANLLCAIKNAERAGRREVMYGPASNLSTEVLMIFKDKGYLTEFEAIENGRGGLYRVQLNGKINDCNAIKPRFPVRKDGYVKWERRFLPAEGFGHLLVSTSHGVMVHADAKQKGLGGKLIAYVY